MPPAVTIDNREKLPDYVRAVNDVFYQIPKSIPPKFKKISAGTVFESSSLEEGDIRALLRQGMIEPSAKPAAASPVMNAAQEKPPAPPVSGTDSVKAGA